MANNIIKETSPTKKSTINSTISAPKNITNNISNIKENKTSVLHNSLVTNSQVALETNVKTSPNKNTSSAFKDSINNFAIHNSDLENNTKAILIANHSPAVLKENKQSVVEVITENDEEPIVLNTDKEKKGIWTTISRTLKNLNHAGVRSVNGEEQENKENTSYAITLGGISIKHKAGNL